MKALNIDIENIAILVPADAAQITGGDFAYDAGFFIREMFIYASEGGWLAGTGAVAVDLATRYQPLL